MNEHDQGGQPHTLIEVQPGELLALTRNLKWQNADLIAFGGQSGIARVGELAAYFDMCREQKGISKLRIVLPPPGEQAQSAMLDMIVDGIRQAHRRLAGEDIREDMVQAGLARMAVTVQQSFEAQSLLGTMASAQEHELVMIAEASRYVFGGGDDGGPNAIAEDIWSAHLYRLMLAAEASAQQTNSYFVLEAGQDLPLRTANRDLLFSAGEVGVASSQTEPTMDVDATIATVAGLIDRVDKDQIGAALAEIEADDHLLPKQKWALRLQMLHRGGLTLAVRDMLDQSISELSGFAPEGYVELARIAVDVDRDDYAQWLIEQALPNLRLQQQLEEALRVAAVTGRKPLIGRVDAVLGALHPHAPVLKRQRAQLAARQGGYAQAASLLHEAGSDDDRERARFFELLATHIRPEALTNPHLLSEALSKLAPGRASSIRYEVMRCLERGGQRNEAVDFVLSGHFTLTPSWIVTALRLTERAFQAGAGRLDAVSRLIDIVMGELSQNPDQAGVRTALARLLDPTIMGTDGLVMIMSRVLELADKEPATRQQQSGGDQQFDLDQLLPVMRNILSALAEAGEGVVRVGDRLSSTQPLDGADPDAILGAMLKFLSSHAPDRNDPTDEAVLANVVVCACAIAPFARELDEDLTILRAAAVQLVIGGRPQAARNLAEQALALAGERPERQRHSLLIYADIYARMGRQREALVCYGAALRCEGSVNWDLIWYQLNLLFRFVRDVGMFEHAIGILPRARKALEAIDRVEEFGHRLDTLELQARERLFRLGRGGTETLESLLASATANAAAVIQAHDELLPITLMLRQLIAEVQSRHGIVSDDTKNIFSSALDKLPHPHRCLVLASGDNPALEDVVSVVASIAPAEASEDICYDLHLARVMAQKLARAAIDRGDPVALAYAAEVLSDEGAVGAGELNGPHGRSSLLVDAGEPLRVALELGARGLSVVLSSPDDKGLVIGCVSEGRAELSSVPLDDFDPASFAQWSEHFPYDYREASDDAVRASLERLGTPELPDRALFVASRLSTLSPNLLKVDANPAGLVKALATTPSLGWLHASIAADPRGDGSAAAWIPVASDLSDTETLALLSNDVADVLQTAQAPLHTGPRPPNSFNRADIAILGAHGGLSEANQYFSSVSDDKHQAADLSDLAHLLHNSRVAVLFVCSGARRDVHPESGSAIGLSRRLIGQGLSAVIAPSWPIEFLVARPWLEAFLASWRSGNELIDATFAANKAVQKAFSYNLRRSLAMSLYGNPFLRVDAQ